jgi:hypothetical protein
MKWCSLVSASLENGWTDLANSVFEMFIMVQIRFLRKKKLEKLPRKLENSGKTESAFFNGNGWNNVAIFLKCS